LSIRKSVTALHTGDVPSQNMEKSIFYSPRNAQLNIVKNYDRSNWRKKII